MTITNSTLSGNSAANGGGGIFDISSHLNVNYVTATSNSAPEGANFWLTAGSLRNSLIANGIGSASCRNFGVITDGGFNLDDDDSCNLTAASSLANTDPQLGTLADNGGLTETVDLLSGSPAIDRIPAGTNGCGTDITTDQRGVARPQGSTCDIGAFETAVRSDTEPPVVGGVSAEPNPADVNSEVLLTAVVDDDLTGGSNIAAAEYNIDDGDWTAMSATDGAFDDSSIEPVEATLTFSDVGTHTVCVRGTDAFANVSAEDCTSVTVEGEPPPVFGDLNGDDCVDRGDYDILMGDVRDGPPNDPAYDLNSDGDVNRADGRTLVGLFTNPRGVPCE
jgi:hypothetical protein